ncbi:hypothetical protein V3W47_04975 [Deinococcus sp. YIM 134068]|uniref:hypothetical protein n=1 Tax=Deinococcus lichenicola TaxID=3118910 RepID=UPI002F923B88
MPHVAGAPAGTHAISNYRLNLHPGADRWSIDVQIGGQWLPVQANSADEILMIMTVLQCPQIGVNNGWIVGSRL